MLWIQRDNQHKLKWECQEDLFRQDVQNADDIRLSVVLLRTCMADKQTYCTHVPYGALFPPLSTLPGRTSLCSHQLIRQCSRHVWNLVRSCSQGTRK